MKDRRCKECDRLVKRAKESDDNKEVDVWVEHLAKIHWYPKEEKK